MLTASGMNRIFERETINLDILHYRVSTEIQPSEITSQTVTDLRGLEDDIIQGKKSNYKDVFYLMAPLFTWGRIQITERAFHRILSSEGISYPTARVLQEFGVRFRDDLLPSVSFYINNQLSVKTAKQDAIQNTTDSNLEMGYLLYYVEENGRASGSPWSLRQIAVHQRKSVITSRSVWIMIESSIENRDRLKRLLSSVTRPTDSDEADLEIHVSILYATASNWARYIDYIYSKLLQMDDKVSIIGHNLLDPQNSSISISDMKTLKSLDHQFLKTRHVLDCCLNVATQIHHRFLSQSNIGKEKQFTLIGLYRKEIEFHVRRMELFQRKLAGTFEFCSKLLELKKFDHLRLITETSSRNIASLRDMATDIHNQNAAASQLVIKSQKDAMSVKALAIISMIFLPASLIATIFSSNLVVISQDHANERDAKIVVNSKFWIFVVVSLGGTIVALGCTKAIERYLWNNHLPTKASRGLSPPL